VWTATPIYRFIQTAKVVLVIRALFRRASEDYGDIFDHLMKQQANLNNGRQGFNKATPLQGSLCSAHFFAVSKKRQSSWPRSESIVVYFSNKHRLTFLCSVSNEL
jgi:hypothetical protein